MNFLQVMSDWFPFVGIQFCMITFRDVLDILLLSVILFFVLKFLRDRRASKFLVGILPLFLLYFVSLACEFYAIGYVLRSLSAVGLLGIIVLLQPEIRAAFEKIGGEVFPLLGGIGHSRSSVNLSRQISVLCDAITEMSRTKTGALIVIERSTKLGDLMETGVILDAVLSSKLLRNLFYNKAPLHDGAVILRHMRVAAAGCVLPNTSKTSEEVANVGTRHRAAIGVSEISDAVVVVVSEETGTISIALGGQLLRDFGSRSLRHELLHLLGDDKKADALDEAEAD